MNKEKALIIVDVHVNMFDETQPVLSFVIAVCQGCLS